MVIVMMVVIFCTLRHSYFLLNITIYFGTNSLEFWQHFCLTLHKSHISLFLLCDKDLSQAVIHLSGISLAPVTVSLFLETHYDLHHLSLVISDLVISLQELGAAAARGLIAYERNPQRDLPPVLVKSIDIFLMLLLKYQFPSCECMGWRWCCFMKVMWGLKAWERNWSAWYTGMDWLYPCGSTQVLYAETI